MKCKSLVLMLLVSCAGLTHAQDAPRLRGQTAVQWGKQLQQAQDEAQRLEAADALAQMGRDAKPALTTLVASLRDRNSGIHVKAMSALAAIGKDAVPALTSAIRGADEDGRVRAIKVLGQIGPDAKSAVSALTRVLKDKSVAVRETAEDSIDKINGTKTARPKGSRITDFVGSWSGKAEVNFNAAHPNAKMSVSINPNGEGTIDSRPGGDSNITFNKLYTIKINSVKDGRFSQTGWEFELNAEGTVLTVRSGRGADQVIYRLKKG